MAIGPLPELAGLSSDELYLVYAAIAKADHAHRLAAMYGGEGPPAGHAPLRILPPDCFAQRWADAAKIVDGRSIFAKRLARQACAYRVDVGATLSRTQRAA